MSLSRSVMTMRATVQRNQTTAVDAWQQPQAPSYAAVSSSPIPCRVWTAVRRFTEDGEQTAHVEEVRWIFPLNADVREGDRVSNVTDRQGNVIYPGPFSIETIVYRHRHRESKLEKVES